MQQTVIVSNRGQFTLPSGMRKKLGIRHGGAVILEERNNELVIKPAAVLEIEMYSDARIAEWDAEDRLTSDERSAVLARLAAKS